MKKLYSSLPILALVALGSSAFAQAPTITAVSLPAIGYVYNMASDTTPTDMLSFSVTPGSGTAQVWNYTTQFVNIYGETTSFLAPSAGLGNSNFPGATMTAATDTNWAYFVVNAGGMYVDGAYAAVQPGIYAPIDYTPNQVAIPVPFTLGNSINNIYSATFTFTSSGNTIQVRHHANRTVSADAYGSLTTPTATYPSTLRVKTYETTVDSAFVFILGTWQYANFMQIDTTTSYTWNQNTQNARLAEIDLDKTGAVTKAQYLQSFSNGVVAISQPTASFNLYPNPATDITYLTYENKATGMVNLQLFDLNGKQVAVLVNENQVIGRQKLAINLAALHLPKGLYFLQLNSNNNLQTIKLSVN